MVTQGSPWGEGLVGLRQGQSGGLGASVTSPLPILPRERPRTNFSPAFLRKFWKHLFRQEARKEKHRAQQCPRSCSHGRQKPLCSVPVHCPEPSFCLCSLGCPLLPLSQPFPALDLFISSLAMSPHLGDQPSFAILSPDQVVLSGGRHQ